MDRALSPAAGSAHVVGLAEWLQRRAARAPHKLALTCDGVTWNYGELIDRVERLSAVLSAGGVLPARQGRPGPDDRSLRAGHGTVDLPARLAGLRHHELQQDQAARSDAVRISRIVNGKWVPVTDCMQP